MKYIFLTIFVFILFANSGCSKEEENKCEFIDITYTDKIPEYIFICRSDNTFYFRSSTTVTSGKYSTIDCINILSDFGFKIKILQVTPKSIEFSYGNQTYIYTR